MSAMVIFFVVDNYVLCGNENNIIHDIRYKYMLYVGSYDVWPGGVLTVGVAIRKGFRRTDSKDRG